MLSSACSCDCDHCVLRSSRGKRARWWWMSDCERVLECVNELIVAAGIPSSYYLYFNYVLQLVVGRVILFLYFCVGYITQSKFEWLAEKASHLWMDFKVHIWLATDCWTSLLAGAGISVSLSCLTLFQGISFIAFHSIWQPQLNHSFIHSFISSVLLRTDLTFMRISYLPTYITIISMPNLATSCTGCCATAICHSLLPLPFPSPSSAASALLALCIYANVKEKFSNFKFSDYIWAAAERLRLTLKSANINFTLAAQRDALWRGEGCHCRASEEWNPCELRN